MADQLGAPDMPELPPQPECAEENFPVDLNLPMWQQELQAGDTVPLRDPRNHLPLVPVPPDYEFTGGIRWNGCVVYWFGVVDRCTQWWRKERRVVFVSDEAIYVAHVGGSVTRALAIKNIRAVSVGHDLCWVNVLVSGEHDLRFRCMEPCTGSAEGTAPQIFLSVLSQVSAMVRGRALPIRRLPADTDHAPLVDLKPRWTWKTPVVPPPRTRASLTTIPPVPRPATAMGGRPGSNIGSRPVTGFGAPLGPPRPASQVGFDPMPGLATRPTTALGFAGVQNFPCATLRCPAPPDALPLPEASTCP